MSSSFRFDDPDVFTAGAVGEPGHRTFFLQVAEGSQVVSLKCEKQQVAALAQYLAELLADLPPVAPALSPPALALSEPVLAEWVVGSMGVAYDDADERFVLVIDELVAEEDEGGEPEPTPGVARLRLTPAQVASFVPWAEELVGQGRPLCPLCGRPMDPEGHACPRTNGHHRPS
ncbi:MAG: DUF3090 domain-containing protein [Acidimicrobiales bacterium]|nr:DUF3090 domain-containing protein [Acidimicrobiales bacterium]MCB9373029.1 DUF3090 domain-containing protein [Microthrixaceae bacterium]